MKIGILTFHCAYNYGAVLQCYALQTYLGKRGHDVHVIDYRPKAITNMYKICERKRLINRYFIRVITEWLLLCYRFRKNRKFEKFIKTQLFLAPVQSIFQKQYDVIIIGSDQVWNYNLTNGFDYFYWGKFEHPDSMMITSYAASMQDKWQSSFSQQIKNNLVNFSMISVRESALAAKLSELTERKIYRVVDPTLLLGADDWKKIAKLPHIEHPYLLLFQVENRNVKTEAIAKVIARQRGLQIVQFLTLVDCKTSRLALTTSPSEFLGFFQKASFVVCSSFHGTAFSLIFNKPFVSVRLGEGKDNRVGNLLESLNMEDHFVETIDLQNDYECNIDKEKFESLIKDSNNFISYIESGLNN